MINIKTTTNGSRVSFMAEVTETINNFLVRTGIADPNAVAMINGVTVSRGEYDKTFEQFGVKDGTEAMLSMTMKTTNAF